MTDREAALAAMLRECAGELAAEIENRYSGVLDYPSMQARYETRSTARAARPNRRDGVGGSMGRLAAERIRCPKTLKTNCAN
jgi:hypothetical protein